MAAATMPRPGGEIKLEYGRTEVFALKFATGKNIEGKFGPRVVFTATDERKLFLDPEDASDLERRTAELGVRAGEELAVTKIRHARGGGHSLRVERAGDAGGETEELLRRSIQAVRDRSHPPAAPLHPVSNDTSTRTDVTAASVKICSTMMVLIDSMTEAKAYAQRRGIDLTNEDLRCLVTTAYIQASREGQR